MVDTLQRRYRAACQVAVKAGKFIYQQQQYRTSLEVSQKSPNDFVSKVDQRAEKWIVRQLQLQFPEDNFIGEEYGKLTHTQQSGSWIIDPLDGTTNFLHGIAHYAVSVAYLYQGQMLLAVVYDPCKQELFRACYGHGAYLNDEKFTINSRDHISGGLYATGIPFSAENLISWDAFQATMKSLLDHQIRGIRRLGTASLDLAYVASNRFDGFWETRLRVWDIAAGVLLIQEAGGFCSNFDLRPLNFAASQYFDVIACCKEVSEEFSSIIHAHYSAPEG